MNMNGVQCIILDFNDQFISRGKNGKTARYEVVSHLDTTGRNLDQIILT